MIEFLSSVAAGGATGLLGTAVSAVSEFFGRRQRHRQELEMRRIDIEQARIEAESAERRAEVEAKSAERRAEVEAHAATEAAEWAALRASYREAGKRWSQGESRWLVAVDLVRGLTRPLLTWAFVALTAWIYATLGPQDAELRAQVVNTTLYAATTCVFWWFGARQVARLPDRKR